MSRPLPKLFFVLILALVFHPCGALAGNFSWPEAKKPPALWSAKESTLTLALLGGVAAFSLLDESLRTQLQPESSAAGREIADGIATVAHPAVTLGVSGLLWGVGKWQGNPRRAETGLLALEAVAVSQLSCAILKVALGRERPGAQDDSTTFQPFSLRDDQQSFPSAHTASAFALAAVLSQRSDSASAPYGYYGAATLVGLARIYQDEHWASDVLAGALIGELSARLVRNWHVRKKALLTISPYAGQSVGIVATLVW